MDSDPFRPGAIFAGRYEIIAKLGEGGFGQVYRARQIATGQEVAIKILRSAHTGNETHIARFQREMQLCAQLYHPNIVRLIDSGREEPETLFTVFEYVPGRTLTDVLSEEGPLPAWEATQMMLQVLDALACAHNRGVIHRDLKPQNLMVTSTGVRRNALVLDFGLGTLPSENQEDLARITKTLEVLGTPTYASPEQLRGDPVTARSDLYSWGLIFLECLTGKRVVDGPTLQAIIFRQLGPEPIAIPSWLQHHRLGRLLRRVTNKNAELRDITAAAAIRELEACASDGWPVNEAVKQRTPTPTPSELGTVDTLLSVSDGERRQLTAVCCSLRLTDKGQAGVDEEDLDRQLRSLHTTCAELARSYDGHVGGVLGEWMLFYFGYPAAQEDDARRATRAALEMIARMAQQSAELERNGKGRVECRVGVHTGLVISQEGRAGGRAGLPALMGTTPNLAVRLEGLAAPGTVLVSEVTSKLLRGHFAFEPVAPGAGSSGPVFRVLHEYRKGQISTSSLAGQLYGRAQELDLLKQRWAQAAAGSGQSILLTGEPGIGKSRLVQELIHQAKEIPSTTLESRCVPEGRNSALSPLVDLLERQLGLSRDWTPEQTLSALEDFLLRYGFVLGDTMPLFLGLLNVKGGADRYPPLGFSPQRIKELTLDALAGLFFEMAQKQPLMLVMEDLHWADPTTLELLALLVKDLASAPLCLVLTARPEFSVPWTASHHVQLSRLDRKRVEEMVSGLTQERPLPRELLEQLVERTDGVPLFVEELTRNVVEALPLGDTPSRIWTPSQLVIPTTLRDSLAARLDRLGPARELAQLAAALGREFSYDVLKAIAQREEPVLQHELKNLMDADLVHRRRGVRSHTYVFKHALIRDTAYESMLKQVRRQVHARIATALEKHFPELVETRPDLLAMHLASAGQKRGALGYAMKAGMAALMRSTNQEAAAYITEALSWLDAVEDPRERAQLELGLNGVLTPALMATRGWADTRIGELVERSQQLIDLVGASPQTVQMLWLLLVFHHSRGHRQQARAISERLLGMARQSGNKDLELMSQGMLGNCSQSEGKLVEAQGHFEQALALYEPAKHVMLASLFGQDARSMCLGFLAQLKWLMGYPEQSKALIKDALAWAQETKHTSSIGLTYIYLFTLLHWRGERQALLAEIVPAAELMRRHGLPLHGMYCQLFRSWAQREVEGVRQVLNFVQGAGLELGRSQYQYTLVQLEFDARRYDAAQQGADELIQWGRTTGEVLMLPELLRFKGLCLRAQGAREPAEACVRQAIDMAREQGARMWELKATATLGELLREGGEAAEARERLAPLVKGMTEGLDAPEIAHARALLEELSQPPSP